jgi:hypothetical protein
MDVAAETMVVARATPARRKPNKRRARVLIDKRYALGRRVKELVTIFRARLGPDADDPVTDTAVRCAAETTALSEDLRARMFRGEDVSPDDALRMSRAADALVRRLHLDRHKAQTVGPSLSDYLRARQEAGP